MKILSKEKDYYDSMVHVYGVDDKVVLNRKISSRNHVLWKILDSHPLIL